MTQIPDCPFCTLHQRVLKENDLAILFFSNPSLMPGHILVSPKRHVEKPWELTKEETLAIFELIFFAQKRITEKLTEGCDIHQNYRPFLKQNKLKVDHVHYHVMPRDFQDEYYEKVNKHDTALFKDLSSEEHDRIANLLF